MIFEALLGCLGIYHLPIIDSTLLYLFIEGGIVEAHIRACRLFDWAVVEVVFGNGATIPSHTMAQTVRNCAFFCEVSSHSAVLALAGTPSCHLCP